jgi:uncharacterized membrane protein
VIVKAGASTTQELAISNPSDKDATLTLEVSGEARSWITIPNTNVTVKAKSSQVVQITISPPSTTKHRSYTALIDIHSNAGSVQSVFVKVKVPQLSFRVSPQIVNVVVKPNSSAEASVLLINTGEADISSVRLTVSGDAASMIQLNTTLIRLKAQGVAEAKLKISVGSLTAGTYAGKIVMTSEDGTTNEVPVTINVKTEADAKAKVTSSNVVMLQVGGGEGTQTSSTVSIDSSLLAALGISIQVEPRSSVDIIANHTVSGEVSKVAKIIVKAKGDAQGKLDVDLSTDVRAGTKSGIYTGVVTLETKSGAKIDVPVTVAVKAKSVANGAVIIDGSGDWSKVKVKASVTAKEGDEQGDDASVDIVSAQATDTEDALLFSAKVAGDIDTDARLYGIRFDTNNDAKADFTLLFEGTQAVLLDANGNQVTSVSAITWAHMSGTIEAAIDKQQFASAVGSKFKVQIYAQGSYDETIWFPEGRVYSLQVEPPTTTQTTTTPTTQPTPPSPTQAYAIPPMTILGMVGVLAAILIAGVFVVRRRVKMS